jgi:Tfp pilus assembly protein PilO
VVKPRAKLARFADMEMMLWNVLLSLLLTGMGWVLKEKSAELQRIQVLLNRTREEIAKEYVTKQEVHADINRVLDRLDRLDEKLDRLMGARNAS